MDRDGDGLPHIISGVIWNIDAARRAEADLAERQMRFERIFRATPAMMHTIDNNGYIVEVSDYWLAHLGYRRDEVVGRKSIDFLDAESRKRAVETNLPELFRTGSNNNIPIASCGRTAARSTCCSHPSWNATARGSRCAAMPR